ncbi:Transcription factor, MADS-box [Cynara cardunculus var. scolymus]|uniref:Transcription factor, MADS-box n=1 Tax=Cynara cardunculus var. scolymus TaxID=59895 RepID=A0A103YIC8_CYNCS|nr:Transcription factor, MADS-box [Cynara cardunculus var. scolymus]
MAKKPSLGRQKIKIAKIQIKNHLQVIFSKRRSGLFKKASELCTLCGVEIAIVVFSPARKLTHLLNELEAEKKRSETLDEMRKASQSQFWWEAPIEDLILHELEQLKDSMEELKKSVAIQANKLSVENSNSADFRC